MMSLLLRSIFPGYRFDLMADRACPMAESNTKVDGNGIGRRHEFHSRCQERRSRPKQLGDKALYSLNT